MKIGKDVSPYDDATPNELEKLGWTNLSFNSNVDQEKIKWMRENFIDVDNKVRWLDTVVICFRYEIDALAFKLRWL